MLRKESIIRQSQFTASQKDLIGFSPDEIRETGASPAFPRPNDAAIRTIARADSMHNFGGDLYFSPTKVQ